MNDAISLITAFTELLSKKNIASFTVANLNSYPLLTVDNTEWPMYLQIARENNMRFVAIWGQEHSSQIIISICFARAGQYIVLRTFLNQGTKKNQLPEIASATPFFPAANRLERHLHDMLGVTFLNHPDRRRWTRHQAWKENEFPLRRNSLDTNNQDEKPLTTPADYNYPFLKASGIGIYEIPVGPVHAGIIEPGHFRFQVAGEDVINLEEHLGYVHKGIEKIAVGRDTAGLLKLAGRVSGDSTVAYAWATCRAIEQANNIKNPPRADFLRAIACERERVINHLWDFAAICNDVAFSFGYYQLGRLRELMLRTNASIFYHRLMMDYLTPGGVKKDVSSNDTAKIACEIKMLQKEFAEIYPILEENSSLHDRLKTTGKLTNEKAVALGTVGFVARASNCNIDLRRDTPHSPYDQFDIHIPVIEYGDVLARVRIRAQEILVSLDLLLKLLAQLPSGPIQTNLNNIKANSEGIGLIEGWRGEIFVYVSFDQDGLVNRFFPRDPSWFNWMALEQLIDGNIVPDFPVCNKSINGSYSGVDL